VSSGSYSSRFTPLTTSAVADAADEVAAVLRAAAGVLLDAEPDDVELVGGEARLRADPERSVPFRHAAGLVHWDPGSLPEGVDARLYADAAFTPPESRHPSSDDKINSSLCYGFVADLLVVEVDRDTLELKIEAVTSVHDSGTILNPPLMDGQTLGSIAHALGGATLEELRYAPDGQMTSASFMDYLCPTAAEMDFDLRLDHIETPSPRTRLGAKGAGEGSTMSIPAAVANAVTDALSEHGVQIDRLPVHGSVLHHLLDQDRPESRGEWPRAARPDDPASKDGDANHQRRETPDAADRR
jgi:2-furoyl-CoA dehydrogenase large subunit